MSNINDKINAAQKIYGLGGISKSAPGLEFFNTPKSRFSYVINFEQSNAANVMMNTLYHSTTPLNIRAAYNVKSVDKPSFTMTTEEINQYNRTRLVQGRLQYHPVAMTLYDTVDSAVLMLLDCYRRYYYGDFANKSLRSWHYNTVSSTRNFTSNLLRPDSVTNNFFALNDTWGRSTFDMADGNGSYFFKRIDIYEIDRGHYTVHNIHNPVIETVQMSNKDYETNDPDVIQLTFKHEGISNICPITGARAITKPIKSLALELVGNDGKFAKSDFYKYFGNIDKDSTSFTDIMKNGIDNPGILGGIAGGFATSIVGGVTDAVTSNISKSLTSGVLSSVADQSVNAIKSIGGLF